MTITKSFTFTNNTIIDPDEVNQNFDDLIAEIKGSHHSDADGTAILPADIGSGWGLIPSKGIIAFFDEIANIPAGFFLCDGNNGTPSLVGKFIQGAGTGYALGVTGGSAKMEHTHTMAHTHNISHGHRIWRLAEQSSGAGLANNENYHGITYSQEGTESAGASNATTSGASNTENRPPFNTLPWIMKS